MNWLFPNNNERYGCESRKLLCAFVLSSITSNNALRFNVWTRFKIYVKDLYQNAGILNHSSLALWWVNRAYSARLVRMWVDGLLFAGILKSEDIWRCQSLRSSYCAGVNTRLGNLYETIHKLPPIMDEGQKRTELYYLALLIAFRLSQLYCMNKTNCIYACISVPIACEAVWCK